LEKKNLILDPDLHLFQTLDPDPDPHEMDADPKPCDKGDLNILEYVQINILVETAAFGLQSDAFFTFFYFAGLCLRRDDYQS